MVMRVPGAEYSAERVQSEISTLLTHAASVSPTWCIPNRPDTGGFESQLPPDPTLGLDCPLFELTHSGAAHWMALDGWTLDEAALLLTGANPLLIRVFDADPNTYKPDFTSCGLLGLHLRLQRAHEMGMLEFPSPPLKVIEWARLKHSIPAPLIPWIPEPATQTEAPLPAVADRASAGVEAGKAGPLPLTTGDIAFCFAGLRWDEQQWKKPLGNKPKWLAACIAIPGARGVSETRWNPVFIGAALVRDGHAKPHNIRAKFQKQPLLKPWLDEWKTYEADYLSAD